MGKKSEYASDYEHILKSDKNCFDAANKFCEGYKQFMDASKTERECVNTIIELAKKCGYKEFDKNAKSLNAGDKYYVNNRNKAAIVITIGKERIDK